MTAIAAAVKTGRKVSARCTEAPELFEVVVLEPFALRTQAKHAARSDGFGKMPFLEEALNAAVAPIAAAKRPLDGNKAVATEHCFGDMLKVAHKA